MRKFLNGRNVIGTIFVFFMMWALGSIGVQFEFLDVFGQVVENFQINDVYYSKLRDPAEEPYESRIILVNIGNVERRYTAAQIAILNQYKPKVIAIDARFFSEKDSLNDTALAEALKEAGNVILGSEPMPNESSENKTTWDSLILPAAPLRPYCQTGHVSTGLPYSDFVTWRDVPIYEEFSNGHKEPCLALKVVEMYDKEAAEICKKRGNEKETIYFKGNMDKFLKLDVEDVLRQSFDSSAIRGNIILMGYMGTNYDDYFGEDKFFTPLNPQSIGRGVPDMYGVVVHANIISMMLNRAYINEMPEWTSYVVAVILCFINVAIFSVIVMSEKLGIWYNAISKSIQLTEVIVVVWLNIWLFHEFKYQANLTLSFAVIALSGDFTEIFVDIVLRAYKKVFKK